MGARKREISKVLIDFLKSLDANIDYKELGRNTGHTKEEIIKIYEGKKNPSYEVLVDILDYYNIDSSAEITKLMEKDSILMYKYWDNVYIEDSPISELKDVIKEMMFEKGLDNRDIIKGFKVSPSYISAMLSGRNVISYNSLVRFADTLKVSPFDILYRLKDRNLINKKKKEFSDYLIKSRAESGWTIEDVSLLSKIPVKRYEKIEQAELQVEVRTLVRISKGMKIPFEEIGRMAVEARLLLDKEEYQKTLEGKKKTNISKNTLAMNLEDMLYELSRYDKINMGGISYKSTTVVTLILMILTNDNKGCEKNKGEIIYYLNHLKKGEDEGLYKKLDLLGITKDDNITMSKVFETYKDEFSYSFLQIARMSGFSKGHISNRNQKDNFMDLDFVERIFPTVQIPLSAGIELMLRDKLKYSKKKAESINLSKIHTIIKEATLWTFRNEKILNYSIKKIFDIIYGTGDAVIKYERIKELNLPQFKSTIFN